MQVQTLVAILAIAIAREKVALGHLAQVVLVQELAVLAFFAEAAQPVLAYEIIVVGGRGVFVGTGRAEGAVPLRVCFAERSRGRDAVPVGAQEEGAEGEGRRGEGVCQDKRGEVVGGGLGRRRARGRHFGCSGKREW
jgi:hypothetical protein